MDKKFVVANWKMNLIRSQAEKLAKEITGYLSDLGTKNSPGVIIAPAFTLLESVFSVIKGTDIELCAQNVFWETSGAYTGEVSAEMLMDNGCSWAIIGHSERRYILGETDFMINHKVKHALNKGLKVILCMGERLEERESENTIEVINNQITKDLEGVSSNDLENILVAYEPVWAIGTGINALPADADAVHLQIKNIISRLLNCHISIIRVLYGGSVNKDNISDLIAQPNIDGVLVGGASLDSGSFKEIIKSSGE